MEVDFFCWLCSVVFVFVVLTDMKIEGAGGGGFLVNWLCSVIFVFEGAGGGGFLHWLCSVVFVS